MKYRITPLVDRGEGRGVIAAQPITVTVDDGDELDRLVKLAAERPGVVRVSVTPLEEAK